MKNSKHLILIGMPGSGKTTLGRLLAHALKLPFLDLDERIQLQSRISISDFWKAYGELAFRAFERKILFDTLNASKSVISTGGGCPVFMDNMCWINQEESIFLECDSTQLIHRRGTTSTPIFGNKKEISIDDIEDLYKRRVGYYSRAKFVFNNNHTVEHSLNNLMNQSFIHT